MQGGFLLFFTYSIFVDKILYVFIYSISVCLPAAILLTIYMKWLDRQQYALNSARVRARDELIKERQRIASENRQIDNFISENSQAQTNTTGSG